MNKGEFERSIADSSRRIRNAGRTIGVDYGKDRDAKDKGRYCPTFKDYVDDCGPCEMCPD